MVCRKQLEERAEEEFLEAGVSQPDLLSPARHHFQQHLGLYAAGEEQASQSMERSTLVTSPFLRVRSARAETMSQRKRPSPRRGPSPRHVPSPSPEGRGLQSSSKLSLSLPDLTDMECDLLDPLVSKRNTLCINAR